MMKLLYIQRMRVCAGSLPGAFIERFRLALYRLAGD
jgi:hypothetical protein